VTKIGIIRCDTHSENCAGFHCFPAIKNKSGQMEQYDEIELVGFDTCGGCGRGKADKIVAKAMRLKERGAEVIHVGNCIIGSCPSKELYLTALRAEVGLPIVEKTHK
jgi:predicted metal-binding protein